MVVVVVVVVVAAGWLGNSGQGHKGVSWGGRKWWPCAVEHQKGAHTSYRMQGTDELAMQGTAEGAPLSDSP